MDLPLHHYVVALGSNQWHPRHGRPQATLEAAISRLSHAPVRLVARSPAIRSRPLGPSRRTYANAVALVATTLAPAALLDHLQAIEAAFGRRRRGARWSARVLDLDIVLWDGGIWESRRLVIPHSAYRIRDFVLQPLRTLSRQAGRGILRDPMTGLSPAHLHARLTRPRALPKPRP